MKQSSIEWLVKQLENHNGVTRAGFEKCIKQAKAMHKEEIENTYWDGGQWVPTSGSQCEEYYNETFNTEEK